MNILVRSENIGKRLTKTPKIYFYDTGLAAWLLGISDENTEIDQQERGVYNFRNFRCSD